MYIMEAICDNASVAATILFIRKLVNVLFIITPSILILLLTIDFAKAVISNDENKIKEVRKMAIKRIVFATILFFVPLIVKSVFGLIGNGQDDMFACYNNITSEMVNNLVEEAKENEKAKEKEKINNIPSKTPTKRVINKKNSSTNAQRRRANGKIAEASASGLQIVKFKKGLDRWKWEYVFRFKDPQKAELAAKCMEAGVANNKYIKYCGDYGELYDKTKNKGFDVTKIKSKTCTTCSPYISVCVNYAGIKMKRAWNAANEASTLAEIRKLSKHFEIIHNPKIAQNYTKLYRGDILFKNKYTGSGHVVMAT